MIVGFENSSREHAALASSLRDPHFSQTTISWLSFCHLLKKKGWWLFHSPLGSLLKHAEKAMGGLEAAQGLNF
jgi:hypothetical protein